MFDSLNFDINSIVEEIELIDNLDEEDILSYYTKEIK
jgi:hypothetical protein